MTLLTPRFAQLAKLDSAGEADIAEFDQALAAAVDYSKQVRAEIAQIVAGSNSGSGCLAPSSGVIAQLSR